MGGGQPDRASATFEPRPAPLAHQLSGIDRIRRVGRLLLADEPGLGKSRTALEATVGSGIRSTLIVAPSLVVVSQTWQDELARWFPGALDDPGRVSIAKYTSLSRRGKGPRGGSTVIPGEPAEPYAGGFDAVIADEAHYTKNRGTNWTPTVENIAKKAEVVVELTGTPIGHWADDLYSMLRVLYPREARPGGKFGGYWRWAEQWFDINPSRFGGPQAREVGGLSACSRACLDFPPESPCQHFLEFAEANLGDHFLRRLKDDVLDLPPVTTQRVEVPMSAAGQKHYRLLRTQFATMVAGGLVEAWSVGAQTNLLNKVTTSEWLIDPTGPPRGGKLDMLRVDLESRSRPTLVFAHYRDTVEACAAVATATGARARFIHGGVGDRDRELIVRDFQQGRADVLVGSLETLAEGLNLTQADMAIFVEMSHKPSRNKQARDRIHRIGQTRPTMVREYVTPKSIDENKFKVLALKSDHQMRHMSAAEYLNLL